MTALAGQRRPASAPLLALGQPSAILPIAALGGVTRCRLARGRSITTARAILFEWLRRSGWPTRRIGAAAVPEGALVWA